MVHVSPNERNYHIFYQVLAAIRTGDSRLSKYDLASHDPASFKILGHGPFEMQDFNGEPVNEAENFGELYSALTRSGFSAGEIESVTDIIIAVLYLGNVSISGDEQAVIEVKDELSKAAELLKVDCGALEKSLLKKTVKYPGQVIEVDLSRAEATSA